MNFVTVLMLAALSAVSSSGGTTSIEVADTVPPHAVSMDYHFRVQPDGKGAGWWGIKWHADDASRYHYAVVSYAGDVAEDPSYGSCVNVTVGFHADAVDSVTCRRRICHSGDLSRSGYSIMVSAGEGGAVLSLGVDRIEETLPVTFPADSAMVIIGMMGGKGSIVRHSLIYTAGAEPCYAQFATIDELYDHLRTSHDVNEGLWTYYDRDTDPLRSRMGGRYALATVSDGAGGYEIVYLGGASEETDDWTPGRLKGHIRPATFPGIFDLEWIMPSGQTLSDDTGAVIDGDLLTIQLPLWRATVRFRRVAVP